MEYSGTPIINYMFSITVHKFSLSNIYYFMSQKKSIELFALLI